MWENHHLFYGIIHEHHKKELVLVHVRLKSKMIVLVKQKLESTVSKNHTAYTIYEGGTWFDDQDLT